MNIKIRIEKLRLIMEEKGLDGIWVSSRENHLYLCGFDNPDGRLLICRDCAFAEEDFRYFEAAQAVIPADYEVIMPKEERRKRLPAMLAAGGVKRIGYENARLSCRALELLKSDSRAAGEIEFVPCGDIIESLREFKDEDEAHAIETAQRIAEKSFEELLVRLTPRMTEREAAAELEYIMKKNGSEAASFDTIAVSGTASSSPHGVPRDRVLEAGFLTFDFGAVYLGYHSDMTRTVCVGRADAKMKRLYETVLAAQTAALEYITCGASCFKTDKIARDIIDGAGYKNAFGHSLGHGVGLEIHEKPGLAPGSGDRRLAAGHIVTVEPGIYLAGKYGCRIEDMVYITDGGAVNLTHAEKKLIELF